MENTMRDLNCCSSCGSEMVIKSRIINFVTNERVFLFGT